MSDILRSLLQLGTGRRRLANSATTSTISHRFGPNQGATQSALAATLALPALFYAATFTALRPFGILPLLVAWASSIGACMVAQRIRIDWRYGVLIVYSSAILLLSLLEQMPTSWTILHDNYAALRHWAWVPMLPVLVNSFYLILRTYGKFLFENTHYLIIPAYTITRIAMLLGDRRAPDEYTYFLYTLTNQNVIVMLLVVLWIFVRAKRLTTDMLLLLLLFVSSSSSQTQVAVICLAAVRITKRPMLVVVGYFIATLGFVIFAPLFPAQLNEIDPNSGMRAILWRDVWRAMLDTFGAGVGYGTEYITNSFLDIRDGWKLVNESRDDLIYVGTHSTYYDVMLRLGIVGSLYFVFWYASEIFAIRRMSIRKARIYSSICIMLITVNSVNMGLSSVNFLFGTSILLSMLIYLRGEALGVEVARAPG